jgi:hypothetical protein
LGQPDRTGPARQQIGPRTEPPLSLSLSLSLPPSLTALAQVPPLPAAAVTASARAVSCSRRGCDLQRRRAAAVGLLRQRLSRASPSRSRRSSTHERAASAPGRASALAPAVASTSRRTSSTAKPYLRATIVLCLVELRPQQISDQSMVWYLIHLADISGKFQCI